MTFGIDSDGNYGYIKAGADTVTPFKKDTGIPTLIFRMSIQSVAPNSLSGGNCSILYLGGFMNSGYTYCNIDVTNHSGIGNIIINGANNGFNGSSFYIDSNSYISGWASYNQSVYIDTLITLT